MEIHNKPNILNTRIVAKSRLFQVEAVDLEFSNGVKTTYERLSNGSGAVMVVPFDGKNIIFSREYCVGTECYELGFTKGKIDPGEKPEQSALRELQEEIGLGAKKLTHLRTITFAPGFMSLMMHIYLAEELYSSPLASGDEPEQILTEPYSIAQTEDLLHNPHSPLRDSRCLLALMDTMYLIQKRL